MKELLQKYLDNGLADFEGLEITGYIPIKQELLNALIADALKPKDVSTSPAASGSPAADDVSDFAESPVVEEAPAPAPAAKKSSGLGGKAVTELVKSLVRRAEVKAIEGALVLEFELRR